MSEARIPEDDTVEAGAEPEPPEEYTGPDPEDDPKGDGSDEDQGT